MESTAQLLYVEDDQTLSFLTKDNLELEGYKVDHYGDGKDVMENFKVGAYDLCILDIMLPNVDGFTLAKEIRRKDEQIPILFLSAKSLKEDKLEGFKVGADDYLTKPFSIEELLHKIKIFLKRRHIVDTGNNVQGPRAIGRYSFDLANLQLSNDGVTKNLTEKEGLLLNLFVNNKNTILKRSEILEKIWGEDDYFLGRSMDVFISRLRKYLGQDENLKIENVHGVGFRFRMKA